MAIEPDPRSKWDPAEVRRVAHRVADMLADYLEALPDRPVFAPVPVDAAARFVTEAVPAIGSEPNAILDDFARSIGPYPFGNGHPRFWAWVNSPPSVMGIFADALAAAMNPSVAGGNHAAVHVERQVIRWFAEMLGLPATAMGLLVSGGSMANLTALAAARHAKAGFDVRARGLQSGDQRLVVYMSEEGHGCIRKAAEIMGIGSESLRVVPVNERAEMRVDVLAETIDRDLQAGYRPIAVAASAGTVNTGAIDDLAAIAAICRREKLWFHVDGAFGGLAALSERLRPLVRGMEAADSLAFDLHKWLHVPYDAGCVLVKSAAAHRRPFTTDAAYLAPMDRGAAPRDPGMRGPELSSEFRALKVWLLLKEHGSAKLARLIEQNVAQAKYLADLVRAAPALELVAPVPLNIVCLRYRGEGSGDLDALNRELLMRLQEQGIAVPSGATLGGKFAIRVAITNHRSRREDFDTLVQAVVKIGAEVAAGK